MKGIRKIAKRLIAEPGERISLKDYDPSWTPKWIDAANADQLLADGVQHLAQFRAQHSLALAARRLRRLRGVLRLHVTHLVVLDRSHCHRLALTSA